MVHPVFPFTEAEFDYWPRPAIGVASDPGEARKLVRSHRPDRGEISGVRLLRREFCGIFPGHVAEVIARCNNIPEGSWVLREQPNGRVIEVTGWFIMDGEN